MTTIRKIHPSATLFVAVLLALFLPFGNAVASCGSENADFTGIEMLTGTIEPNPPAPGSPISEADREFVEQIEQDGWFFMAALTGLALIGLVLATMAGGRLWGTCCALIAIDAALLALFVNFRDAHIGFHLAFWPTAIGALLAFCLSLQRWYGRSRERQAAIDTTPEQPLLR
jgi:hypothetical protein